MGKRDEFTKILENIKIKNSRGDLRTMKKTNKFLAITAALTIGFGGLTAVFTEQPVAKANELQQLKSKNAQLEAEAAKVREQIKDLESQINSSQAKIDELNKENERLAKEIEETTAKMEVKKAELGATLQATQKAGKVGMLDIILGGKDFSDTVNRMALVRTLTTDQQDKVEELDNLEDKLQTDKTKVNENLVTLSEELNNLESAKGEHASTLSGLTSEQRAIIAEIEAMEELNRQMAAARAAQAAPQRGGGGGVTGAANEVSYVASNAAPGGGPLSNLGSNWDGTPYRFGGTGAGGIDCSSFTQQVMAANGKSVPRTSAAQYAGGQKVDKGSLQPGDIVAFNTGGGGVSHVGVYVGNGQFRHADSTRGVTVSNLNSGYWSGAYVGGARY